MSIHTAYKFRHRRPGPDGVDRIIWASGLGDLGDLEDAPPAAAAFEVIRAQPWTPNALTDQGEQALLDVFFRNGTAPTFYFALYNDTPVDTDTLATLLGEPASGGYGRLAVARNTTDWPTLGLQGGDYRVDSATKTWTASGGSIGPVNTLALVSVASGTAGTFYAHAALSAARTLADGDSLDVSMQVTAS